MEQSSPPPPVLFILELAFVFVEGFTERSIGNAFRFS